MHPNPYDGISITGASISVVFCFISQFTVGEWAAIATIGAAVSTIGYNIVRTWLMAKKKKDE